MIRFGFGLDDDGRRDPDGGRHDPDGGRCDGGRRDTDEGRRDPYRDSDKGRHEGRRDLHASVHNTSTQPINQNGGLQGSTDTGGAPITIHRLNGQNYLKWASSVRLFVTGKGKFSYLNGSVRKPAETDPKYCAWEAEDSMVQSWLVNSMTTDISASFTLFISACDVWEAARDMFASLKNRAAILDVEARLE